MPPNTKKRHKVERDMVLARLAAVETLGLLGQKVEQTSGTDRTRALTRIKTAMLPGVIDDTVAGQVLDMLLRQLRDAPLNINFRANEFFAEKPKIDRYQSKFEKMRTAGAPMGKSRDEAEGKMFGYTSAKGTNLKPGESAAKDRMAQYGDWTGPEFQGVIRPRYCSLNFAHLLDGFGAQWGRSHFVLRDHLKPNASYLHTDSFDEALSSKATEATMQAMMATFHNMTRLVANMPDVMLEMLIDSVSTKLQRDQAWAGVKKKYNFGSTLYIEAQVHSEIIFARDLAELRICREDLTKANGDTAKKYLDKFASKNGVTVTYFD